ncbi:hypothetical protein [Palleronia caenipelagi]|uniref:Uncharacterized protein n=1 Tax=Palleronia caenipelagi TaxID=2489174 RepID=A0A547PPN3_9RHOB|nr:hypothetical protein [Palleronia caenipelagi]TRD16112.1 hypothetical protein FEV53_14605 [Palleronia caenipelagi]
MTHIHKLRIVLPSRMAGIAPHAARQLVERMVDGAHDRGGLADAQPTITLTDTGQTPSQFGLMAAQTLPPKPGGHN